MKLEMTNFQAVAAGLSVEGEVCDLPNAKFWMQAKTDAEMAPIMQKLGATPIADIERLIVELQEAKDHLQLEKERIEREVIRYTTLTQMASTTAKIISDAVSQWHPARNEQKSNTSEAVPASPRTTLASGRADIMVPGTKRLTRLIEKAPHIVSPRGSPEKPPRNRTATRAFASRETWRRNIITRVRGKSPLQPKR